MSDLIEIIKQYVGYSGYEAGWTGGRTSKIEDYEWEHIIDLCRTNRIKELEREKEIATLLLNGWETKVFFKDTRIKELEDRIERARSIYHRATELWIPSGGSMFDALKEDKDNE